MTIVRREHRAQFTIIPNAIFVDGRLSIEAKGVLGYLLSRPHSWQVRLEHVGRTLRIGRKKLQRIFRELISAGYVTREQPRTAVANRFSEMDYVVRDVPAGPVQAGDNSATSRGRKGPAAPRVQKGPAYKDSPQVPNGPAYKELDYKKGEGRIPDPSTAPELGLAMNLASQCGATDDARFDADIVALFRDRAEGWELLSMLPSEVLLRLRDQYRRRELNAIAVAELENHYRHLLARRASNRHVP